MTVDHLTASGHQARVVVVEPGERPGGGLDQAGDPRAVGPGHVPQPLHRVHRANGTPAPGSEGPGHQNVLGNV